MREYSNPQTALFLDYVPSSVCLRMARLKLQQWNMNLNQHNSFNKGLLSCFFEDGQSSETCEYGHFHIAKLIIHVRMSGVWVV